jgi:hypothetical protein
MTQGSFVECLSKFIANPDGKELGSFGVGADFFAGRFHA